MTALLEYQDLTALLEYINLLNRYSRGPGAPIKGPLGCLHHNPQHEVISEGN